MKKIAKEWVNNHPIGDRECYSCNEECLSCGEKNYNTMISADRIRDTNWNFIEIRFNGDPNECLYLRQKDRIYEVFNEAV